MRKFLYGALAVVAATTAGVLMGCATGRPLAAADLDEIGWENTPSLQCYLSSRLTLTKLPDPPGTASVNFNREGAAVIRNTRSAIVLPTSLEGRVLRYHRRDRFLYVAFEEGGAALPFAMDKKGAFSLMVTVDSAYQGGVEFVEYEGVRYKPSGIPRLHAEINWSQNELRRQMQGSQVSARTDREDTAARAAEQFTAALPDNSLIAVLAVSGGDQETASFITEELEHLLVASGKFRVVERGALSVILDEQNFQMFAGVSDETAVSIGSLLGANIVITGAFSGSAPSRRLTLKALEVETAQILSTFRESL